MGKSSIIVLKNELRYEKFKYQSLRERLGYERIERVYEKIKYQQA